MAECSKCKLAIRGESGVQCAGVCKKEYHLNAKCCGLDQYSSVTTACSTYIHNLDIVLTNMQEGVRKNKQQ